MMTEKVETIYKIDKVKEESYKLDKNDINAVANSRFFRREGQKMLMLLAIIILALAMLANYVPFFPFQLYYALDLIAAVVFVYMYVRKQAKVRKSLWDAIDKHNKEVEAQNK